MRVFILEDDKTRIAMFREALIGADVTVAMDVEGAKKAWQPPYSLMLLDHDLGDRTFVDQDDENCGTAFVKWLTEYYKDLGPEMVPFTLVHSWNIAAADWMENWLCDFGAKTQAFPFGKTLLEAIVKLVEETKEKEQATLVQKEREQQARMQTQEFAGWGAYWNPDACYD